MISDIIITIYVIGIALFYGVFRKTKKNATPRMLQILAVFWPIIIISDFGSWLVTDNPRF